mgnify:CR=1 FL=1
MAVLAAQDVPARRFELPARCLVGRSRACDLVLPERQVSAQHAALEWTGERWQLRDLASSNGTYLDDRRLPSGDIVPLRRGAVLRFSGDDGPGWCLVDDGAPALMAVLVPAGDAVRAEWGYLALPDAEAPELAIYQDTSGAWLLEAGGATTPLEARAVVSTADGALWRIHLPTGHERTVQGQAAPLSLADLTLRFACSRDEEYISLTATGRGRTLDLKARAHHYPLLLLARRRLADERAGLPEAELGWVTRTFRVTRLASSAPARSPDWSPRR